MIMKHEEFQAIWNSSKNVSEVVERSGLTKRQVEGKAHTLRQKGVSLKRFPKGGTRHVTEHAAYWAGVFDALAYIDRTASGSVRIRLTPPVHLIEPIAREFKISSIEEMKKSIRYVWVGPKAQAVIGRLGRHSELIRDHLRSAD